MPVRLELGSTFAPLQPVLPLHQRPGSLAGADAQITAAESRADAAIAQARADADARVAAEHTVAAAALFPSRAAAGAGGRGERM